MSRKVLTLVLPTKPDHILLGYKKRGFGMNKWNGFGGKVEENESIREAALRELKEECGLTCSLNDLVSIGKIDFEFLGDPIILEVHIFSLQLFKGVPVETEEMIPKWFNKQNIPFNSMWPDDKIWYPLFLAGKKFHGYFLFQGHEKILKHNLMLLSDN